MRSSRPPICSSCPASGRSRSGSSVCRPHAIGSRCGVRCRRYPDWLHPGVNGYLAPGDPPTSRGLADAIIACLEDPATYARLCDGAGSVAAGVSLDRHVDALMQVLHHAAGTPNDHGRMEMTDTQR